MSTGEKMKHLLFICSMILLVKFAVVQAQSGVCSESESNLAIGDFASVTVESLDVLSSPEAKVPLMTLRNGDIIQITAPATCLNGITYWGIIPAQTSIRFGLGYIAEGEGDNYFILTTTVPTSSQGAIELGMLSDTGGTPWWGNSPRLIIILVLLMPGAGVFVLLVLTLVLLKDERKPKDIQG
jgi:hypothetical protein